MPRFARLALYSLLGGALAVTAASAQPPGPGPEGVEVLARGPVHEAFAATAEMPTAGPIIQQMPPNPVEELPPDEKPEGDNVQWISGYWHFDEERRDFVWISGFWRVPPPGRVWLPGGWREVQGGRQWVHGFWQEVAPALPQQAQVAQQLEYLPPPPQPLEIAPSVPQPDVTSFYVPGSWVWRGHYVWRPGYWVGYRPNWVWVPAHFRYTPGGCLFVDGYWDYPLERRGVLFAPVYFAPVVLARPAFYYTPTYAVSHQGLVGALFVRRGYSSYYFGDYFEQRYTTLGFNAWCGNSRGTSFALNINVGRGPAYDPLWNHYQIQNRDNPVVVNNIQNVYVGRYNGEVARPARTLVQQTTVVNNITNVTNTTVNNTTVNNTTVNNTTNNKTVNNVNNSVSNLTMVQPLKTIQQTNNNVVLKSVPKEERVREQQLVKQTREIAVERSRAETQLADKQLAPTQATDKPRQVKLDLPKQVIERAQAPEKPQFVLPPRPTARQAALDAKTPPTIPPANDTKPVPPAPATLKEMPTKPLPVPTPVTPVPAPVKPEAKPEPTPVKPTPATPMPVKPEDKPKKEKPEATKPLPAPTPVTPAPTPAPVTPKRKRPETKPAPVPTPAPTPTPAPVTPVPVPTPAPAVPKRETPADPKPLPAPVVPQPMPTPVAPAPVKPKRETPAPVASPAPVVPPAPTPVAPAPAPVTPKRERPETKPAPVPTPAPTPTPAPVTPVPTPAPAVPKRETPADPKPLPAPAPPAPVAPMPQPPKIGVPPQPPQQPMAARPRPQPAPPEAKSPPATVPQPPMPRPAPPVPKDPKDDKDSKTPA